jgi:hydrogenase nickel incorporation protein HypA/HybF
VEAVHLRIGPLSGVVKEALASAYELAREQTPFARSRLVFEDVPLVIYCGRCQAERAAESIQQLCCAECGEPAQDVRRGRELEIAALELEGPEFEGSELEE